MTTTTKTAKNYGGQASAEACREYARTATDTTDIMVALHGAGASLDELAAVHGIGMAAAVNIATNSDGSPYPREDARRAVARWIRYARAELELAST